MKDTIFTKQNLLLRAKENNISLNSLTGRRKTFNELCEELFFNKQPLKYTCDRFKGKNKYTISELREIALSHNIHVRIDNKYKTYQMLVEELIDSERLNGFNLDELHQNARNLNIPNYLKKSKKELLFEIEHFLNIRSLHKSMSWYEIGKNPNKISGLTKLRDIARHLKLLDYSQKTKSQLYNMIYLDYITYVKNKPDKSTKFTGICKNENILGEDWSEFDSSDVVVDEHGYCFMVTELLEYYISGNMIHPWIKTDLGSTMVQNKNISIIQYINRLIDNSIDICSKMLAQNREYQLTDITLTYRLYTTDYLINRLDDYIKSAGFYIITQDIYTTLQSNNLKLWWSNFKQIHLFNQHDARKWLKYEPTNENEILELINQMIDSFDDHLIFNFKLILYMLFRRDKSYTIRHLNYFLSYGFPDDAFQFNDQ